VFTMQVGCGNHEPECSVRANAGGGSDAGHSKVTSASVVGHRFWPGSNRNPAVGPLARRPLRVSVILTFCSARDTSIQAPGSAAWAGRDSNATVLAQSSRTGAKD